MKTTHLMLTADHIKLLRRANVRWDDGEAGAPAIDCKRPYGNSDVECDVAEILGWERWEEMPDDVVQRALRLHCETEEALQVVLSCGTFEPGLYERSEYGGSWRRVGP